MSSLSDKISTSLAGTYNSNTDTERLYETFRENLNQGRKNNIDPSLFEAKRLDILRFL